MDQSDNLNHVFWLCCYFRSIFVSEMALLNPCLMFSKNLILSLIDKVKTGTESLALIIWNVAPVVCIAYLAWTRGLPSGLPATLGAINIFLTMANQVLYHS